MSALGYVFLGAVLVLAMQCLLAASSLRRLRLAAHLALERTPLLLAPPTRRAYHTLPAPGAPSDNDDDESSSSRYLVPDSVRHFLLAVRAVLKMADMSPENLAYQRHVKALPQQHSLGHLDDFTDDSTSIASSTDLPDDPDTPRQAPQPLTFPPLHSQVTIVQDPTMMSTTRLKYKAPAEDSVFDPLLKSLFNKATSTLLPPIPHASLFENLHLDPLHMVAEQAHTWMIPGFGSVRFIDYAPLAFKVVRDKFGYELNALQEAIGEDGFCLIEQSCGKSESLFFTTKDERFKFKTLRGAEADNLRAFLPDYLAYIDKNPNTLLPRYLGLYTFEPPPPTSLSTSSPSASVSRFSDPNHTPTNTPRASSTTTPATAGTASTDAIATLLAKPFTIVAMANVFGDTPLRVAEKFDFKGSSVGRRTLGGGVRIHGEEERLGGEETGGFVEKAQADSAVAGGVVDWMLGKVLGGGGGVDGGSGNGVVKEGCVVGCLSGGGGGEGDKKRESLDLSGLTLKELDFERLVDAGCTNLLHVGVDKKRMVMEQLEADVELLKRHGFMDYSLLVGIYRKPKVQKPSTWNNFMSVRPMSLATLLTAPFKSKSQRSSPNLEPNDDDQFPTLSSHSPTTSQHIPSSMEPISYSSSIASSSRRHSPTPHHAHSHHHHRSWIEDVGDRLLSQLFQTPRMNSNATSGAASAGRYPGSRSGLSTRAPSRLQFDHTVPLGFTAIDIHEDEEGDEHGGGGLAGESRTTSPLRGGVSVAGCDEQEEEDGEEEAGGVVDLTVPFSKQFLGGIKSEGLVSDTVEYEVYFIGLIDALQKFNFAKWIERGIQRKKHGASSSAIARTSSNSCISQQSSTGSNASCVTIRADHPLDDHVAIDVTVGVPVSPTGSSGGGGQVCGRRVSGSLAMPEVSVEEPGRYAERLLDFVRGVFV
ncbi:Phosphatidylinositol 5-phosphate 4-kinase type-2 alpha [Podochytrium sp. JEL0797]|nr:Phosphatidylinositol 5-phosphate 4-kinase type-2 alpha [Podochytrium sp. JEL0797]